MRFAIAVVVAAAAQLVVYLQIGSWVGAAALVAILYVLFAALGAGWFAGHRAALAGALSVFAGAALYGIVSFFGPAAIGAPLADLVGWELRLVLAVIPYAIGGAAAGAAGGWLRGRALRRA
jgi:hypothetical protein